MKPNYLNSLTIVAFALLLTLPAMLHTPMSHDSFWIDWVWADQFTSELARGNPYPRWLPRSHDGLGSPVFYYYPPFAFYVTGLFGLAGLSTYASIIAAFLIGLAGSGLAMHAWLRGHAKFPLLGALLFMAMPYHLLDFYVRGALAEFMAIALVPVVAIGIRRAAEGRYVVAALSYAALIMTHLPLALLVSLFLIAPYSVWLSREAPRTLVRIAVPIGIGIALSAIYLLPALMLESFRDTGSLWADGSLKPENWSMLRWGVEGPPEGIKFFIASVILVLAYTSMVVMVAGQRKLGGSALLCCILAAGLIPFFWQLPLLQSVQFPFRLLPIAEFALATAAARLQVRPYLLLAAVFPIITPSIKFLFSSPDYPYLPLDQIVERHPDVPENLPPGDRPHSWPSKWALDLAERYREPLKVSGYTIEPVFYYPAWEIRCQGQSVESFPERRTKLLAYQGSECERQLTLTQPERLGMITSLVALFVLLAMVGWRRITIRRRLLVA